MDYPVRDAGSGPDAIAVWANYHQFGPGETRTNRDVHSRALVWNDGGGGSVEVDGVAVELPPGRFVFAPWQHDITYRAAARDPFRAAAIHLVPAPRRGQEIRLRPPGPDDVPGRSPWPDDAWAGLEGLLQGSAGPDDRLLTLARLAVDHVQNGRPDRSTLQAFAQLVVNELRTALSSPLTHESGPARLVRMQQYVLTHLHLPLSVAEVATVGGVSESTARRLFREHTQSSVLDWISAARMARARELLRSTGASVAEVGRTVGIHDPAYFSRVFRRTQGLPPSVYAERAWRL